ncbi:SirB2 family protein [Pantoea sp. Cy-640]|uniref:SirB2 family protein n=1 Tax=Pantoea sp. Cy-640 TaxID=2608353 RepID=UPI00141A49EB|nr:SirB2 family protein [Pantoea sp. Cy-640]NIG13422.1 siroheme synthase [Pantoea sp. Cy-640]
MASWYPLIKNFHLLTVAITITLFLLRFYWLTTGSALLQRRWVRIVPHVNDTCLLLSGALLVLITHFYPFTPQGSWLTEKLLAVIIYIALGSVALSRRPRSMATRWVACLVAVVALLLVIKLAMTKMPLLGIV